MVAVIQIDLIIFETELCQIKSNSAVCKAGKNSKTLLISEKYKRIAGRHFFQIPGPSAAPERKLGAFSKQTIDYRGPAFAEVGQRALRGLKTIFKTKEYVFIYPASGAEA